MPSELRLYERKPVGGRIKGKEKKKEKNVTM